MPRFALVVAYDGTDFEGSQGQTRPGARTVDGTLKAGLESLLGQAPRLLWASRTDSGVHAEGNVCVFDAELPMPLARLADLLNSGLPEDLRIRSARLVVAGFHPRFDAISRTYRYLLCGEASDITRWRYWWEIDDGLHVKAMAEAAQLFLGRHGFAAFAAGSLDPENSICAMTELELNHGYPHTSDNRDLRDTEMMLTANRFLRHMVCRIVGALVAVGQGRLDQADILAALQQQKRLKFKPAPARGLTLVKVSYPGTEL